MVIKEEEVLDIVSDVKDVFSKKLDINKIIIVHIEVISEKIREKVKITDVVINLVVHNYKILKIHFENVMY